MSTNETTPLDPRLATLSPQRLALLKTRLNRVNTNSTADSILRVDKPGPVPLSYGQQRIWLHDQLQPNSPNNIARGLRLTGQLNVQALQHALDAIVERHEPLRTTYTSIEGDGVQVIHPACGVPLPQIDLSTISSDQKEAKLQQLLDEEALQPFDLKQDLMLRAMLVRLAPTEHAILFCMHHIASDGWSLGLFLRELSLFYNAYCTNKLSPLPQLSIRYRDYAYWQQQALSESKLRPQIEYWSGRLANASHSLDLPTDFQRPPAKTLNGACHWLTLPSQLSHELRLLGTKERATPFMTHLAALQTLLFHYTHQTDICIGSFFANRPKVELENLIGFFVNTVVLRADLSKPPTFRQLLAQVRETAMDALSNQDMPFEKLLETLKPQRDLSRSPIFQVAYAFQNAPEDSIRMVDLEVQSLQPTIQTAFYDLTVEAEEAGTNFRVCFTYDTQLFELSSIERMGSHFQRVLEEFVDNPEQRLDSVSLLTSQEQHLIESTFSPGPTQPFGKQTVPELIQSQAERTPDAPAVESPKECWTYRQLNTHANELAAVLQTAGVCRGSVVALCAERSPAAIAGMLAILKCGAAFLNLDPVYPPSRLAFILDDAKASAILVQRELLDNLPQHEAKIVCLDEPRDVFATGMPATKASPTDLAYIIYTSGSTGQPKGVAVEHSALTNYVEAAIDNYKLLPSDRVLQFASLTFDACIEEIFPTLASGGTLVLRTDGMLASAEEFTTSCSQMRVTVLSLPTIWWQQWLQGMDGTKLELPSTLRLVVIGGDKALPERLVQWHERIGNRIRLLNTYGPTETTVIATLADLTSAGDRDRRKSVSIGKPIRNTRLYITNQQMRPAAIGVPGELYIGGAGLARGYVNRTQLTAERFVTIGCERLYRTGDIGRWREDGSIEFLGRSDRQVKIRGFRVELDEIEHVLRIHPAVRECAVVEREESPGELRLVAYVVRKANSSNTSAVEMRSFARETLPEFMLPSSFMFLDKLPLTPSGKLDRHALPAPTLETTGVTTDKTPPGTPVEETLVRIWCEVLRMAQVGIHDNFFEMGGHSLLAMQTIARVRQIFQVELPLRLFFEGPTVAEMANAITNIMLREVELLSEEEVSLATEMSDRLPREAI